MSKLLFTSESVTEGHPDKACDAISDAILDNILSADNNAHVACETLATKGVVVVSGEIRTSHSPDVDQIVKNTIKEIGYHKKNSGVDPEEVKVISMLHEQSSEIAQGVDSENLSEQGAGDQGLMFGYACKETPELMPLPIQISQRLTEKLSELRKDGSLSWVRPDGKSQVSVNYENGNPISVDKVVIATQHDDMLAEYGTEEEELAFVKEEVINNIIQPVLDSYGYPYSKDFIVNGTGRFVYGGPEADTGLTGRKIIVDTYGGAAPHGGGAFSGKDPTKVDRSAAYAARYLAKNIVASGTSEKCLIQLAYAIGVSKPLSIFLKLDNEDETKIEKIKKIIEKNFDLSPRGIREMLKLNNSIYEITSAYGHFGRKPSNKGEFTWEKTDKVDLFKL